MKKNIGSLDKALRIIVAIVVAGLYYFNVVEGTLAIVLMVFSITLLVTSLINFCPMYTFFGINTCKVKQ